MQKETISFNIKSGKNDIHSIEFYRSYSDKNNKMNWSYIDSSHPMDTMELHRLKDFLQEYLKQK